MNVTAILVAALVVGGVGILIGFFLGISGEKFKVEVDEKEVAILGELPGNNCGGCGFPGCSGMAEALVTGDMDHIACKPCKADKRQEIVDYLKNTPGPDGSTVEVKG
jgi:electron transport complex protein RnfB